MPPILRKIGSIIWWVIRIGGVAGSIRDAYQVIGYLAAYGPALLITSVLSTFDFTMQMPLTLRLVFFAGVFFCTLAISGTLLAVGVRYFFRQEEEQASGDRTPVSKSGSANNDTREVQELEYENQQLRQNLETAITETGVPLDVATRRDISNCSFRLIDLLRLAGTDGSYIVNKDFENCTIYGPGVITREGRPPGSARSYATVSHIPTLYVEGSPDSALYESLPNAVTAVGVIHLIGCSYKRVTFSGVGIAGSPEEIAWWRENCTFSGPSPGE